jgi:hypothetical protein
VIVDSTITSTSFSADSASVTVAVPGMRVWQIVDQQQRRLSRR